MKQLTAILFGVAIGLMIVWVIGNMSKIKSDTTFINQAQRNTRIWDMKMHRVKLFTDSAAILVRPIDSLLEVMRRCQDMACIDSVDKKLDPLENQRLIWDCKANEALEDNSLYLNPNIK